MHRNNLQLVSSTEPLQVSILPINRINHEFICLLLGVLVEYFELFSARESPTARRTATIKWILNIAHDFMDGAQDQEISVLAIIVTLRCQHRNCWIITERRILKAHRNVASVNFKYSDDGRWPPLTAVRRPPSASLQPVRPPARLACTLSYSFWCHCSTIRQ